MKGKLLSAFSASTLLSSSLDFRRRSSCTQDNAGWNWSGKEMQGWWGHNFVFLEHFCSSTSLASKVVYNFTPPRRHSMMMMVLWCKGQGSERMLIDFFSRQSLIAIELESFRVRTWRRSRKWVVLMALLFLLLPWSHSNAIMLMMTSLGIFSYTSLSRGSVSVSRFLTWRASSLISFHVTLSSRTFYSFYHAILPLNSIQVLRTQSQSKSKKHLERISIGSDVSHKKWWIIIIIRLSEQTLDLLYASPVDSSERKERSQRRREIESKKKYKSFQRTRERCSNE